MIIFERARLDKQMTSKERWQESRRADQAFLRGYNLTMQPWLWCFGKSHRCACPEKPRISITSPPARWLGRSHEPHDAV